MYRLVWKGLSSEPNVASFRYRSLLPAYFLKHHARVKSHFLGSDECINFEKKIDVIILIKASTKFDLQQAWIARKMGIPIVFDLCDNIFVQAENFSHLSHRIFANKEILLKYFRMMLPYFSAITTSSEGLAHKIRQEIGDSVPVHVIPDTIETNSFTNSLRYFKLKRKACWLFGSGPFWFLWRGCPKIIDGILKRITRASKKQTAITCTFFSEAIIALHGRSVHLLGKVFKRQLVHSVDFQFWLNRTEIEEIIQLRPGMSSKSFDPPKGSSDLTSQEIVNLPRVLWFGNAGFDGVFGVSDLLCVREALKKSFDRESFKLVIMTNNGKFAKDVGRQLGIPFEFVPWSKDAVVDEIRKAKLCLIPNPLNEFTINKSANRSVLSFHLGTPVMATYTEALMPFKGVIPFDQWEDTITRWLRDPGERARVVELGQKVVKEHFSDTIIVQKWLKLIDQLTLRSVANEYDSKSKDLKKNIYPI